MVVAAALGNASPGLGHGPGNSVAANSSVADSSIPNPGVIVDLSAIDQAVAARRLRSLGHEHQRLAEPDRSGQVSPPSAPLPGTAAFHALFPPPPPVPPAAPATSPGATTASVTEELSPAVAVAALPVARPVAQPATTRFAAPVPRRPVLRATSARFGAAAIRPAASAIRPAVSPVRYVGSRVIGAKLAPVAKPLPRPEAAELDRRVRARLGYPVAGTDLSPSAQAQLETLVAEVGGNDRLRLRLAAYANAGAGSPGKARRTSIARALAVRGFLIERGIKASRIDLRALGNTAGAAEADRVDVMVADK